MSSRCIDHIHSFCHMPRRRGSSRSPGCMLLVMAGTWRKMLHSSWDGPYIQVHSCKLSSSFNFTILNIFFIDAWVVVFKVDISLNRKLSPNRQLTPTEIVNSLVFHFIFWLKLACCTVSKYGPLEWGHNGFVVIPNAKNNLEKEILFWEYIAAVEDVDDDNSLFSQSLHKTGNCLYLCLF